MSDLKPKKLSDKIGLLTRKAVGLSPGELVEARPLHPDNPLPLLVKPAVEGVNLAAWAAANRDFIGEKLAVHGAILFRGFPLVTEADFQSVIQAVSGDLLKYSYRSTPRTEVGGNIYTSTEYPADQQIPQHNEMAYTSSWPMKLWFFCARAAETGGETPLVDSRKIYQRIDPAIREAFAQKKVKYVRNYRERFDLPWQVVFQTSDKAEVEAFCRNAGIDFEWKGDDELRTSQVCQGVMAHPKTGEMVWFNQAHLFHVSSLNEEVRESLLEDFGEDELPRNAFFGDGSPIDSAMFEAIREAYRQELVVFPWKNGDLLLVDNMLAAHGRMPYSGPRRILVGMTEPWSESGALGD